MAQTFDSTAVLGCNLLQQGITATKYGRHGKPHPVILRLSGDEKYLYWQSVGLAKLRRKSEIRTVRIGDVLELLVGPESDVLRKWSKQSLVHVSVSLRLRACLPPPPSTSTKETKGRGKAAASPSFVERASLDLSIENEEHFGLLVAAVRALIARTAAEMGVGGVTEKEREALQREMNELRSALAAERERKPAAAATAMAVSAGVALIEASDDAHEDRGERFCGRETTLPNSALGVASTTMTAPTPVEGSEDRSLSQPASAPKAAAHEPHDVDEATSAHPMSAAAAFEDVAPHATPVPPVDAAAAPQVCSVAAPASGAVSTALTLVSAEARTSSEAEASQSDRESDEAYSTPFWLRAAADRLAADDGSASAAEAFAAETQALLEMRILKLEALLAAGTTVQPVPGVQAAAAARGDDATEMLAANETLAATETAGAVVSGGATRSAATEEAERSTQHSNPFAEQQEPDAQAVATAEDVAEAFFEESAPASDPLASADELFAAAGTCDAEAAAEDLFSAEDESAEAAAESMFGDLSDANGAHETNPFAGEEFIGGDVNPFA